MIIVPENVDPDFGFLHYGIFIHQMGLGLQSSALQAAPPLHTREREAMSTQEGAVYPPQGRSSSGLRLTSSSTWTGESKNLWGLGHGALWGLDWGMRNGKEPPQPGIPSAPAGS